jgi:hypothetical protein
MVLTTSTFMLCFTFLGQGSEGVGLFWSFLAIGVASMAAFFFIEKRSENPLINLKLAFHKISGLETLAILCLALFSTSFFPRFLL